MTRATIAGGAFAFATVLAVLDQGAGLPAVEQDVLARVRAQEAATAGSWRTLSLPTFPPAAVTSPAATGSTAPASVETRLALEDTHPAVTDTRPAAAATHPAEAATHAAEAATHAGSEDHQGFLYGRITTGDGATYEGRLRFGGDEEAFWGDYFNGFKDENPWADHVPPDRLPRERRTIQIFGIELVNLENRPDLGRPFMARFGDIARIEARGRDIRVTFKSGTVFDLDRYAADDLADGVRVWDATRGVVDLDEWPIRTIELLPNPLPGVAPYRLHGTVRTRAGDFTGFVQWDREEGVGLDALDGDTASGDASLRFDTISSIARRSRESSLVTLLDGREMVLAGSREAGHGNRGMYVDDRRYGRVLVSWEAFERVDFSAGGSGPAYSDFPPGHALTGSVTTRAGRRLAGRLVFDLDESETTETLDAPSDGVDYTIPFGLIASLALPGDDEPGTPHATVTLLSGEALHLEPAGDLRETNAGLLVFADGRQPEYVPWADVEQVDFDRLAIYPPRGGR